MRPSGVSSFALCRSSGGDRMRSFLPDSRERPSSTSYAQYSVKRDVTWSRRKRTEHVMGTCRVAEKGSCWNGFPFFPLYFLSLSSCSFQNNFGRSTCQFEMRKSYVVRESFSLPQKNASILHAGLYSMSAVVPFRILQAGFPRTPLICFRCTQADIH